MLFQGVRTRGNFAQIVRSSEMVLQQLFTAIYTTHDIEQKF